VEEGTVRQFITIAYRVLFAAAGFAVVVLNALIEKKVVHWSPLVAVYVASGVGLVALVDNLGQIKLKYDARDRDAARSRMHKPVVSALLSIAKTRQVDFEQLGISAFSIRRKWIRKWKIFPWYAEHLHRPLRFRLSDYPPEADVTWFKGKGAIGECWDKGISVLHDRRPTAAAFGDPRQATKQKFDSLTDEQRCGLTYSEFVQTLDRYGEILAVPIRRAHSGELIGVLSIDCLADAYASTAAPSVLDGVDIEVFAQRAANVIRDDIAKF
jgi:hypothetical protein